MKKISLAILTLLVALTACKKVPEVNLKYVDVECDLITAGTTTATVQCDYQYIATLKKAYFYYCEGENEADMNSAEMRVVQNTLYVDLVGLKENTTYSYFYEFHNSFNSMRTEAKTFKTEASPIVVTLPTVITAEVTEITENSAQCGGEVTNDGGAEVIDRGICWSTNANPTLNDNHIVAGFGLGGFTVLMDSLQDNTIYHVRAYATNEMGTAYGLNKEFTTLSGGDGVPEGAIDGLFTINENGDQVYFSQGNLQYTISTQTWSFMKHQYDIVETNEQDVGTNYSNQDVVSLFGWGTSGWDNGNRYYQPYNTEGLFDFSSYCYGPTDGTNYNFDLTGIYANADWGVYNAIVNGGDVPNLWRILIESEWVYVFNDRTTTSGIRFAKGIVNGVNGVILLPDDWSTSVYSLNFTNRIDVPYSINRIVMADWRMMEANGAVFLPAAGYRSGGSGYSSVIVGAVGYAGGYWSASCYDYDNAAAYGMHISDEGVGANFSWRRFGLSVRLVQDANK